MSLIVHGVTASPFVRKVCVVLEEKGVAYTLQRPDFPLPEDFRRLHPLLKMPVLEDTCRPAPNALPDSSVICDYIESTQGGPKLYPADPWDRSRALWFEEYADGGLFPAAGPGLFRQRVLSRLMGFPGDEALAVKTVTETLPPMFDYLERELTGRAWLVGDAFGIADIAIASPFVNIAHAGERVDAARWPALAEFVERVHARSSFAGFIETEKVFFARALDSMRR